MDEIVGKPLIFALTLEIFQNAFIQINLALRQRRQRERQKRTSLISKKNNSAHAAHFFYIFCRHCTTKTSEKFPHGMFDIGQKNTPRIYFLSPSKFGLGPEVKS